MSAGRGRVGFAAAGILAAALLVAACSSGGGSEGSDTTTTAKPADTTSTTNRSSNRDAPGTAFAKGWPKDAGGECDGHTPGKDGVLMTFCHGPAKITVTTSDGHPHEMAGVCWRDADKIEVDAGVTVGTDWKGAWPDYVTFRANPSAGDVSNHVVAWIGGTEHLLQDMQGTIKVEGLRPGITIGPAAVRRVTATYQGEDLSRQEIKVDVDC